MCPAFFRMLRNRENLLADLTNWFSPPAEGDPDGVSELWFDSRDDFVAAYATEIGQAVVADTLAHVASRQRMFVDEHPIAG